ETRLCRGPVAWYLAHDVLGHPQPFFAPIAAAVSLSISNVLRAQRAIQMMIGVTLGIGMGTLVQGLLGPGAISIAGAALIALCASRSLSVTATSGKG
ncbi:MAG TPA: FUSC family protein, partial [Mycobacterium sp.]|nr:FUSC family protein [Mycobacterium sp.]